MEKRGIVAKMSHFQIPQGRGDAAPLNLGLRRVQIWVGRVTLCAPLDAGLRRAEDCPPYPCYEIRTPEFRGLSDGDSLRRHLRFYWLKAGGENQVSVRTKIFSESGFGFAAN